MIFRISSLFYYLALFVILTSCQIFEPPFVESKEQPFLEISLLDTRRDYRGYEDYKNSFYNQDSDKYHYEYSSTIYIREIESDFATFTFQPNFKYTRSLFKPIDPFIYYDTNISSDVTNFTTNNYFYIAIKGFGRDPIEVDSIEIGQGYESEFDEFLYGPVKSWIPYDQKTMAINSSEKAKLEKEGFAGFTEETRLSAQDDKCASLLSTPNKYNTDVHFIYLNPGVDMWPIKQIRIRIKGIKK